MIQVLLDVWLVLDQFLPVSVLDSFGNRLFEARIQINKDVAICLQLSYVLVQFDFFVCPIHYDEEKEALSMECERNPVFRITELSLPETLQGLFSLVSSLVLSKVGSKM